LESFSMSRGLEQAAARARTRSKVAAATMFVAFFNPLVSITESLFFNRAFRLQLYDSFVEGKG